EEGDLEEAAKQTAQDFEESSAAEAKAFKKGSRVTKADLTNNILSIDRSLDKHLYLLQKITLGSASHWLLPQERFSTSDRSLRETAERILAQLIPSKPTVKFLGNAPAGYYWYRYPKTLTAESGILGARVFFFKATLDPHIHIEGANFGERIIPMA